MPNNRYSDNIRASIPVNDRTQSQVNTDLERSRQESATRQRFADIQQENERIRAEAIRNKVESERPIREEQQRQNAALRQQIQQRYDENQTAKQQIFDRYRQQSAQSSSVYQDVLKQRREEAVMNKSRMPDITPGRPPINQDFESSANLRGSRIPLPSAPPINLERGGEMVHVPQTRSASIPTVNKPSGFKFSGVGMSGGGLGFDISEAAATSIALDYMNSNGRPNYPGYNPGNSDIEQAFRNVGNALKDLARSPLGDRLADLLKMFPNPHSKHPNLDPKNDVPRPTPQRYAIDWRGVKFWSPNNRRYVQIACPLGQYQLGESHDGFGGANFASPPGSTSELFQEIIWENLQQNLDGSYYSTRASATCNPDTIEPDPSYIPPQVELPVLTTPDGTTPDISNYPPIFTEDDFKPYRDENARQARQNQNEKERSPDPIQERNDRNQRENEPTPSPWDKPVPIPSPVPSPTPYPTDDPSPTDDPTDSNTERIREKARRIRERVSEMFPPPETSNDPNSNTNVTINGVPAPRPGDPIPDTTPRNPTSTKPPVEPRLDPTTGTSPQPEPEPEPEPQTEPNCSDPCLQKITDKLNSKGETTITVKIFKSCQKPVAEGQVLQGDPIEYEEKTIKVPKDEVDNYKQMYEQMFKLQSAQCSETKAIATVPEWWQLRRGSNVPQLVILFAEVFSSGKLGGSRWSLSIPHYNRPKGARPSIPAYTKGNWFGSLKLTDGSKLGVNASSATECKKVLNRLKIHIPVEFRTIKGKAIKPRITEDPNSEFKSCKVTPIRADYYSQGQVNPKPDWSINLRKNS